MLTRSYGCLALLVLYFDLSPIEMSIPPIDNSQTPSANEHTRSPAFASHTNHSSHLTPATPWLDLKELRDRCMNNDAFVQRILTKFQSLFTDEVDLLVDAVEEANWEQAALVAHRIKGASLNIAANPLGQLASTIELRCRSSEPISSQEVISQLLATWEATRAQIDELLDVAS
jgi:HPt (histidine-containing phosphotransfer) domain-containing protein